MNTAIRAAAAAFLFGLAAAASAGTQVLGFEIGVSTAEQVRQALAKSTRVHDAGVNRYSGGPMLKTNGASYDITGLKEVVYIFDEQKKLAAVLMELNKSRFAAVFDALNGKYKVTTQQRPFVGDQFASFRTEDAVIEVDAPHLSFDMAVRYLRRDLLQKFNAQSAAETAARTKSEAAKF